MSDALTTVRVMLRLPSSLRDWYTRHARFNETNVSDAMRLSHVGADSLIARTIDSALDRGSVPKMLGARGAWLLLPDEVRRMVKAETN